MAFTIGCWLLISFFAHAQAQAQWGVQPQPQPQPQQQQQQPAVQRQPVVQQFQQVQQIQQQQQLQQLQQQQLQQQQQPQLQFQRDSQSQQQPQFQRPKVIKYNVQANGDEQGDAAAVNRQAEARNQELLSRLRSLNSRGSGRGQQQPINDADEEAVDQPKPTRGSSKRLRTKPPTSGERSQNQVLTTRRQGNTVPPSLQGFASPFGQPQSSPFGQPQSPFAGLVGGSQQFGAGQFPSFNAPGSGFLPQSGGLGPGPIPGSGPSQNTGIVSALSALGSQLGRSLGLGGLLGQSGLSGLGNIGIPQRAPPVAGIPQVPGIPFPGIGQGGQFDIMGIVGGISRRALNGSRLSDVLPPDRIQQFAENVTEILVPEMPDVDLPLYMGRWFEGISSPRASSQRCVVHHYGGLTENGKTATFTALKIYREGNEFGQVQYSIGYAFRGGRQKSMLQMHSSESQDATPYWVYHLGPTGKDAFGHPQYEYAVVSNWIRYPVMVLVRDPDEFKKNYEVDVLRWLEDHGFINDFARTFNLIQPVDYSNCQYSDSTFAAFGK